MPNLEQLDLSYNDFSGPIPGSIDLPSIQILEISSNSLIGYLPSHCRNLTTLALTLNFRDETLPDLPNLHFEKLKTLVIVDCRLKGSIPLWFKRITALQLLDLSWNHLVGKIPPWFGSYRDLFYLDLSNNLFIGEIPKSLTELLGLIHGNISLEEPSPGFPFFLKRNASGRGLRYNKIWRFPPILDRGHNFLSEPIWPEFGYLRMLHVFDLKFNNFSGPIPVNLSEMINLEILDLSHNNLSGTIPSSLQSLVVTKTAMNLRNDQDEARVSSLDREFVVCERENESVSLIRTRGIASLKWKNSDLQTIKGNCDAFWASNSRWSGIAATAKDSARTMIVECNVAVRTASARVVESMAIRLDATWIQNGYENDLLPKWLAKTLLSR
ncbi:hypothetical protein J1N35_000314 [Gossypium stocksii]|uniref:Leucine-rich repeat-containing N-terminal plant-type domain-containing protein n=1 Tax=Gossypium stocksii TaxID=47602 RepID=A0A9D3WH91_9ROSI|nr:hypothetical protein J1N35_000314 [Gossypium stocksii]